MSVKPISSVESISEKIYTRLLGLYPAKHLHEYGPLMAQLFRDQCREAYHQQRSLGLLKLWCRVLPDIAATSVVEHIAAIRRREVMFNKLALAGQRWLIGLGIFLLSITASFVITSLLPRTYVSKARLVVHKAGQLSDPESSSYDPYLMQRESEILKSRRTLYPVIQELKLDRKWGARYAPKISSPLEEAYLLLRNSMEVRQFRNTSMLELGVYHERPLEAAEIANRIAGEFCRLASSGGRDWSAEVTDKAEPGFRPVRPNPGLNLGVGMIIGLVAGGLVALWPRSKIRLPPMQPSISNPTL